MKAISLILMLEFVLPLAMHARLGEDRKQIEQRYGPTLLVNSTLGASLHTKSSTIRPGGDGEIHLKKGVLIEVNYLHGICQKIRFVKAEAPGQGGTFSAEEVAFLMVVNPENVRYKLRNSKPLGNGYLMAEYDEPTGYLGRLLLHEHEDPCEIVFMTPSYVNEVLNTPDKLTGREVDKRLHRAQKKMAGF